MFRGHHHNHGGRFDSYSRRGGYNNDDIELIQQFRDFKPYLKKRIHDIERAGRAVELQDEVDDIKFYLEVMDNILADEAHGRDQLQSFIDKIHEMIRKNPVFESSSSRRRSLETNDEEFGDDDRPRSPSPGARGPESATNIPLIPTHGAHRTVEVNFSPASRNEPSTPAPDDGYDEWGRRSEANYTRRESYRDIDMRNNVYPGGGRGERRWSGDSDFSGAQGMGRGMGRGIPLPNRNDDYHSTFETRTGRGRGLLSNDAERHRQDLFHPDRSPQEINHNREREFNSPDWLADNPTNGSIANDWQPTDHSNSGFRTDYDRRREREEAERRRNHAQLERIMERRPSSETRRDSDSHSFARGRDDDRHNIRSRNEMDHSPTYSPHSSTPPVNQMSYPHPPPPMPYGIPQRPGLYPPAGLLPTPNYGGGNPARHPNASAGGVGLGMPNIQPPMVGGVVHPMHYPRPPISAYNRPGMMPSTSNYRIPPPQMPRIRLPPHSPHHSTDQYLSFPSYSAPVEPSPEEIRDITMAKAKNCFNRAANRNPTAHTASASSTVTSVSLGPTSPNNTLNEHQGSSQNAMDPRVSRLNKAGSAQNHQQSLPLGPHQKSRIARTDAGNILRPTSDPRSRSKIDEERRKSTLENVRARQQEATRPYNKPSKLQELRKQFEKDTLFRLGRPPPKKQGGSFEDAITSCDTTTDTSQTSKTAEKNKVSSTSQSKDKEDDGRQQRSHSDKTERDRSPKKGKARGKSKSANADKEKKNDKGSKSKSQKKTDDPSRKPKKSPKKSSGTSSANKNVSEELSNSDKGGRIVNPNLPPTFKIPRKPKPVQVQSEPPAQPVSKGSRRESLDKNLPTSTTPPDSPEPALSEVPDADNRSSDDTESSTSTLTKSTSRSSSLSSNPDAMEVLKQFIATSAGGDTESILSNPVKMKDIFSKIMNEISAAKEKSSDEGSSTLPNSTDKDKNDPPDEEVQRGRSREKKRNTKRRSSLEKLHDALKEMRFDQMLPLGPRRCTRVEATAESSETSEVSSVDVDKVVEETTASTREAALEEETDKQPNKKRGRPPKVAPKAKKKAKAAKVPAPRNVPGPSNSSALPQAAAAKGKGKKRKLKAAKLNPPKRIKKSGPVTRAQAALKKSHKDLTKKPTKPVNIIMPDGHLENVDQDASKRRKKTTNMILRRLNRSKKIGPMDTVVNRAINKIKLESDFVPNVKADPDVEPLIIPDPEDRDIFANFDDLTQMIDDQLNDEAFANLDKQTDDNVDLTVFNTLDSDEQGHQVTITHEVDLSLEETPSELSYERVIQQSPSTPPSTSKAAAKRRSSLAATSTVVTDTTASTSTAVKDSASLPSTDLNSQTSLQEPLANSRTVGESSAAAAESAVVTKIATPNKPTASTEATTSTSTTLKREHDEDSTPSAEQQSTEQSDKDSSTAPPLSVPSSDSKRLLNESLFSDSVSSSSSCSELQLNMAPLKSAISEDMKGRTEPTESPVKTEPQQADDLLKFKCEFCSFSGKKIVHHYVNKHYPCNIPQARLQKETFDGLLEMNESGSPQLLEITLDHNVELIWPCLYCDGRFSCIVDFYDHLTTHTGEFRFQCGECSTSYPYHKSLVNHVKQHKGTSKNCVRTAFESGIGKTSKELSGFLCNDCFYFQLRFESIMHHIDEIGHNALEVKSVRLIRPSALGTANSTLIKDEKLDMEKYGLLIKRETLEVDKPQEGNKEISPGGNEKMGNNVSAMNANQEVFFGTEVDFSPPSVTLNECTLVVPNVFENKFLDSLLKKVTASSTTEGGRTIEEETFPCDGDSELSESRKRKRNDSFDDEIVEDSSCEGSETSSFFKDGAEEKSLCSGPTRPRVCILKKMRLRAKKKKLEANPVEPNDFFVSSDESSDESGLSDDSDGDSLEGGKSELSQIKIEVDSEFAETLRSNEHLVKTKVLEKDQEIENYMEKRNLVMVRRPGDLHAPNTVLFGYIRPPSATGSTKLRDGKEIDKLGGVHGRRLLPMKEVGFLREMITREKLVHLFKCMGTYCSYTTDNAADFQTHLNVDHVPIPYIIESCARFIDLEDTATMKDADCCSYCSARYKHSKDLVNHIINQHGQSTHQCNRCFYRSFYQRYVVRHFDLEHPNEPLKHVLKCPRTIQTQTQEATLFQIFVYKCNIDNPTCDKSRRFVFREDYLEHLQSCAPKQDLYPCHLCPATVTFEDLIEHYKVHNLFKFHCSYCQFGSEVKTDLDEHFVSVHPNTSGRVFYRVKPTGTNQPGSTVVSLGRNPLKLAESKGSVIAEHTERAKSDGSKDDGESSLNSEKDAAPNLDDEDGDRGRVTNLKGCDLYRCVTGDCSFTADDIESFKEHVTKCSLVADSRSLACAHCERKLKSVTNLLEHMKVHGEKKQVCSICSFRCWTSTEITKHIKAAHKVMSYKLIKKDATETDIDPDVIAFPKDVFVKSLCDIESFENNYFSFAKRAVYSFENIDKLPNSKIFSADLFCAMCPYSTKVRTNIVRHLSMHKQALEDGKTVVPQAPRINPVPYLSREGLEFDKMMNLAASSHKTDGGPATADVRKLPQFVKDQFRYVCSVCDHITSDESLLQTHIKVIHSEVTSYKCPHCHKHPESRDNPEYTVSLEKISHHLRLHGPKLYKCGHCTVVHYHLRSMEKHLPEKHPEKKPIHYLIRDVDPDGVPSNRPSTSGIRRQSVDDPKSLSTEKWKCFLCSSKSVFGSWDETKSHCEIIHKVSSQFMCLVCDFSSDDVTDMLTHCRENCKSEEKNKILVMFSKCEAFDGEDSVGTAPVWKRCSGAVRHIHGNFTEDSVSLIKHYNSQQNSDSALVTGSPSRGATAVTVLQKNPVKPTASSAAKARRSVGGSVSSKPCSPVKNLINVPSPSNLPKVDVFKFRCHKCDMYKTIKPNDLRVHLFNEFGYKRWKCLTCNTTFTTEKSLKGHIEKDHQKVYQDDLYEMLPAVPEIEAEIEDSIEKQCRKRDLINSFAVEKLGKLTCRKCKDEEGLTYETFETHILLNHSS